MNSGLILAAESGKETAASYFLSAGADLNFKVSFKEYIDGDMFSANLVGNNWNFLSLQFLCVKYFQYSDDPLTFFNHYEQEVQSALGAALSGGYHTIAMMLIRGGASLEPIVDVQDDADDVWQLAQSPLIIAVVSCPDVVPALLSAGADVNYVNRVTDVWSGLPVDHIV